MSIELSNLTLAYMAYLTFQEFVILSRKSSIHQDRFHLISSVTLYKFALKAEVYAFQKVSDKHVYKPTFNDIY